MSTFRRRAVTALVAALTASLVAGPVAAAHPADVLSTSASTAFGEPAAVDDGHEDDEHPEPDATAVPEPVPSPSVSTEPSAPSPGDSTEPSAPSVSPEPDESTADDSAAEAAPDGEDEITGLDDPVAGAAGVEEPPIGILGDGFNAMLRAGFNKTVRVVSAASDGGVLIGGAFTALAADASIPNGLVRFTPDGVLDTAFHAQLGTGFNGTVYAVHSLADGGILVAGSFTSLNGDSSIPARLVRLNADGSLDRDFNLRLGSGFNGTVWSVSSAVDGQIVVGGEFTTLNGESGGPARMARLNPDGSRSLALQAALGSGFSGAVYSVQVDAAGGVIVGGSFTDLNGDASLPNRLLRLGPDGTPDPDFNANLGKGFGSTVRTATVGPDGSVLVGGAFTAMNGSSATPNRLMRLLPDGRPDQAFNDALGSGFNGTVWAVTSDEAGRVLVAGEFTTVNGRSGLPARLVRLTATGSIDEDFCAAIGLGLDAPAYALAVDTSGAAGYLIGGAFQKLNGIPFIPSRLVFLDLDGGTGPEFNSQLGVGFTGGDVRAVAETKDGGVVVGGDFTALNNDKTIPARIVRLNEDGSPNREFNAALGTGTNGIVLAVAETPDGGILVGGDFTSVNGDKSLPNRLVKFTADGTVDAAFAAALGKGFGDQVESLAVDAEGRILVGGSFTSLNGSSSVPNRLLRLLPTGEVDREFSAKLGSGFNSAVHSVDVDAQGRIAVGGTWTRLNGSSKAPSRVIVLQPDGSRDADYDAQLGSGLGSTVWSVSFMADGGLLIGGENARLIGRNTGLLIRLYANGAADREFAGRLGRGFNGPVYTAFESSAGTVVVGGSFTRLNGRGNRVPSRLLMLNSDGTVNAEFKGELGSGFNSTVYTGTEVGDPGRAFVIGGAFTKLAGSTAIPQRLIALHTARDQPGGPEPTAPVIEAPTAESRNPGNPLMRGTGTAGRTLELVVDEMPPAEVPVNEFGHWLYRPSAPLTMGGHTLTVTDTEMAESDSLTFDVAGHTVAPWGAKGAEEDDPAVRLVQVDAAQGGEDLTIALTETGGVHGWTSAGPVEVGGADSGLIAVSAGKGFFLGLTGQGTVIAWGPRATGSLAVPSTLDGAVVVAVEAGQDSAYALLRDGTVVGWGSDKAGQLQQPEELAVSTVIAVAAGTDHVLALTGDGIALGWGGSGADYADVPEEWEELTFVAAASGTKVSYLLDDTGNIHTWGATETVPAEVQGSVAQMDANQDRIAVRLEDGKTRAWGGAAAGWADGTDELRGDVVAQVAVGRDHAIALVDHVHIDTPEDGSTEVGRPVFSGTSAPTVPVTLTITGERDELTLQTQSQEGHWSVAPDRDLPPGTYTVLARSSCGATHQISVVLGQGTELQFTSEPRTELVEQLPGRNGARG
ncbi:hypothetical protein [Cellulomonas sp. NPDC089187]|uniref:hypothetical protein n=1 Tax=Cellulomonas sp. NPDC089187 TaxID=3154970 RepID=UPI00342E27F7